MGVNLTAGLLLRHAFYLAFGALCGVTFLNGWGAIFGAAVALIFSHFTSKWRKEFLRLSILGKEVLLFKDIDNPELLRLKKYIGGQAKANGTLFLHELFFQVFEILPINILYLYFSHKLLLLKQNLYLTLANFLTPFSDLLFGYYTTLDAMFLGLNAHQIMFFKAAISGVVLINGFAFVHAIFKLLKDTPRFSSWTKRAVQSLAFQAKRERWALYGGLVFGAMALIIAPELFEADGRSARYLARNIDLYDERKEFFSALYWYCLRIFTCTALTIFSLISISSYLTTYYWMNRK